MRDEIRAGMTTVTSRAGDEIEAYVAHPAAATARGGVVVIHHMPGFDSATHEITRRFAVWGYDAVCPNLHYRAAPGAARDDAAAATRAAGGVLDDRLVDDVAGSAEYLRSQPASNGKVGTIGFCSGGRQSVLAACRLPLEAAVDCYGAFVLDLPPDQSGLKLEPIVDLLPDLSCPLLGLFGEEDSHPGPAEVAELDRVLVQLGKEHEFHSFAGAGHGFFAVDRPAYRQSAAGEGWELVHDFFGRHLAVE